jgi:hypothetical protein
MNAKHPVIITNVVKEFIIHDLTTETTTNEIGTPKR